MVGIGILVYNTITRLRQASAIYCSLTGKPPRYFKDTDGLDVGRLSLLADEIQVEMESLESTYVAYLSKLEQI
jgi:hypothetical protein